jgi:glutamyl/glutaminyl-tRNA synthetase
MVTRFAPSPTGFLHIGHVANAIYVWRTARTAGGRVLLRMEDHDRIRCRPEYEAAILEDLEWLEPSDQWRRPSHTRPRLVLKPNGDKLSKGAGDAGVRQSSRGGMTAADVIAVAAAAVSR